MQRMTCGSDTRHAHAARIHWHTTQLEEEMGLLPSLKDLDIELPDVSGLIREGELLMATLSEQIPILVDSVVRYLDSKTDA